MKYMTNLFLTIEARARSAFERFPFVHAFLAGIGVVLFWRGVWESADMIGIPPIASIVSGVILLGAIGLYLQTFVGNTIIIKEVEKDKQLTKKTEKEVKEEEVTMEFLAQKIETLSKKLDSLHSEK